MIEKENILNNNDKKIISWLSSLSDDFWDFKTNDTKELTHGFHSYPATMIYPISRNIIKKVQSLYNVDTLFDPFSGSGTVPVEGVVAGVKNIYATDLNPLSIFLTEVKTTSIENTILDHYYELIKAKIENLFINYQSIFNKLNLFIKNNDIDISEAKGWGDSAFIILNTFFKEENIKFEIPNFKNMGYWFKPTVILKVQLIKNILSEIVDSDIKNFYMLILSETIRVVSNKRNGEFKMYRIEKDKLIKFDPDVKNIFLNTLEINSNKMKIFNKYFENSTKPNVNVSLEDTRDLKNIPNNSVDLIVTSPPYGDSKTTVAYGEFSKLSLQWIDIKNKNIDITKIDKELLGGKKINNEDKYNLNSPTLEISLKKIENIDIKRSKEVFSFYNDLDKCIYQCSNKSKKDSYQFWVVGNRTVKDTYLETDKILVELSKKYGMIHVTTFTRNIHNKVMPSLNSPSNKKGKKNTTMTNEFIVVLRKE
jgi:modification methylase mvaI